MKFTSCCLTIPEVLVPIQWIVKFTSCHLTRPTFLFVCPSSLSSPRTYSKIYMVTKTNKQKKNFIINIRLLCRWEFHKWLMNISKGKHKGGRYEAGSFFRNTEFTIITQEHGETLIFGRLSLWPHSLGSLVLLSCKYVSLGFFFFF